MKMIKKYKWNLVISSIVILLPMILGVFGDKILPAGYVGSDVAFFVLPAVLLGIHWLCILLTLALDKNNQHNNNKMMSIMFWVIPTISLASCGVMFAVERGYTENIYAVVMALLGISFIVIGNYMPKTTRNVTMGIKVKWTLSSDENWYATHRFASKVYVVCGFVCLLAMPLPDVVFPFVTIAIIVACCALPLIYSYRFYKQQLIDGKITKEECENAFGEISPIKNKKTAKWVTIVSTSALVIVLSVIMFTGNVEMSADEDSLDVKASYWGDLSLKYDKIDSIEYRENGVGGQRVNGWGSARLLLGTFKDDEIGMHTRYTYTGNCPCIVIKSEGRNYVIGVKDASTVKAIYEQISAEIAD